MFEKNMKVIKQKYPELAERIEKIDLDSIENITVTEAENQDLIIGYKEIALHSMVDPVREARAIWNKIVKSDLRKNDVQIVFGLGLGYLFKRAYANTNSKIILIEPFAEILRFVLQHVNLSAELADERVYITDNVKDVINKLKEEYLQGDKAEFLFLPAYTSLAREQLEELTEKAMKIVEEKASDVNTIFYFAPRWVRNFIVNIPYFFESRPLGFFKDKFADKTALILAAGPSLAENIEKIKQNRDKFVTFATGKAFPVLIQNGITPDFVTFADATGVKHQVKGVEDQLKNTNVILTSRTDFHVVELEAKNKILYLPETDPFSELFRKYSETDPGIYRSASSVSIINYFIAKVLGFSTIAFAGLDLAFPDNKIYATGENLELDEEGYIKSDSIRASTRTVKFVKDKNGQNIQTRDDYIIFIRQFEEIFEEETSLSRVINTSVKGAYIKGMDYINFDKFIENLSSQELGIDGMIDEVKTATDNKWKKCIQNVFNNIRNQKSEILEIKEKAELIFNEIQNMLTTVEQEDIKNLENERYNEARQNLVKTRKHAMENLILKNSLQGELWRFTKDYRTDNVFNKEVVVNNLKTEKRLFKRIYNHSVKILEWLDNAAEKTEGSCIETIQ